MLINQDSEEFRDLSILRLRQKAYEEAGDFVTSKQIFTAFNSLVGLYSADLIKQIDEANKEQGE